MWQWRVKLLCYVISGVRVVDHIGLAIVAGPFCPFVGIITVSNDKLRSFGKILNSWFVQLLQHHHRDCVRTKYLGCHRIVRERSYTTSNSTLTNVTLGVLYKLSVIKANSPLEADFRWSIVPWFESAQFIRSGTDVAMLPMLQSPFPLIFPKLPFYLKTLGL